MDLTDTLRCLLCSLDTAVELIRQRGTADPVAFDRAKAATEAAISSADTTSTGRDLQATAFMNAVDAATHLASRADPDSRRRLQAAISICRHYNGDDR